MQFDPEAFGPRVTFLHTDDVWQENTAAPFEASEYDVSLGDVSVQFDEWTYVMEGGLESRTVALMEEHGFDYAPVLGPPDRVNIVDRATLCELLDRKQQVTGDGPFLSESLVFERYFISLERLFQVMEDRPAAILCARRLIGNQHATQVCGFITRADLNAKAVRQPIFSLLLDLETNLARLIETIHPEPMEWIALLAEDAQAKVLGYRELTRVRGYDSSPIAATNLSELIRIAIRSQEVRKAITAQSRSEFESAIGRVNDLRHKIMHPVRPLVLSPEDVQRVGRALKSAREIVQKLPRRKGKPTGI